MFKSRIKPAGKVFRDPIHQLIRIDRSDDFALELIDTPEFQRLRRIRQLGVSWLTYPGAEHSRFVHSLGVFNFVQRMLQVLIRRYAEHDVANYLQQHARLVKAAALLHDIGHGPFSHMIERAFGGHVRHEDKTVEIIRDTTRGVGKVLQENGINAADVAGLIQHTFPHPLLTDLVTSQLDADRMDYLLRDSHSTGVQYGSYDAEWLLNAMCVGRNPRSVDGNEPHREWRLALDERRGEKAAEQFILARAHMNEQVYFHRVTRGFESLLLNLFRLAAKLAADEVLPKGTPDVVERFFGRRGSLDAEDWLRFDESMLLSAFHVWSKGGPEVDPELARLSGAFLNRERLYGCVPIGGLKPLKLARLLENLRNANLVEHRDWCTDDIESAVYKGILYASRSAADQEEEELVESILLACGKPDRRTHPIETSSPLMDYLERQRQSIARLYFDRSRQDQIAKTIKEYGLTIEAGGGVE